MGKKDIEGSAIESTAHLEKDHTILVARIKRALSVLKDDARFNYPETIIQQAIRILKGDQ